MNPELKKIIESSSFIVHEGTFIYSKVRKIPTSDAHFLVSKDAEEITVVTKEEYLSDLDIIERNKDDYTLIELKVSVPFYAVGFLAAVSSAIAGGGMNVLIVSTYSKDYLMVRVEHKEKAVQTLIELGFKTNLNN